MSRPSHSGAFRAESGARQGGGTLRWDAAARSGMIVDIQEVESDPGRKGLLGWITSAAIVQTGIPFLLTAGFVVAVVVTVAILGPRLLSDALLAVLNIRIEGVTPLMLILMSIIFFVAFRTMMGGGRSGGGGMTAEVFALLLSTLWRILRALLPVRGLYRALHRLFQEYVIRPLRNSGDRKVTLRICRLERQGPAGTGQGGGSFTDMLHGTMAGTGPETTAGREMIVAHLKGELTGAGVFPGQKVTFFGAFDHNGIFQVDHGFDDEVVGAKITLYVPRSLRRL